MTSLAQRVPAAEVTPPAHPGRDRRADLLMLATCLAGALYLTIGFWQDPNRVEVSHNKGDQALFEWLLAYAAHSVTHGTNPLWTTLLNAPIGVNLAVNTSMIVVGALVAPITFTLGAPISFLVVLTANLVLSPYAWYHVLSRHVTRTRAAAVLGGLFCGFAPGIVSHANGHLNFTSQFLVPFILLYVVRLREPGRAWRHGLILGVLVAVEFSIAAELLFFVALGCAVFLGSWALMRRAEARAGAPAFLRGLGVTSGLVALLLSYPLYMQFAGPQRYHGIGFDQRVHSEDLAAFGAIPYLSEARRLGVWVRLAPNFTEETTFFGPLLLTLILVCFVVLWRRPVIRALAVTAGVFAVLALGPRLNLGGHRYGIPLPYALLARLPVFDAALPARFALMLIPMLGLLLALTLDRALLLERRPRGIWLAAFAAALLPLVPLPIPALARTPVPHFFAAGTWRQYVHSGQTLVPIPPPSDLLPDGQRWQAATNFGFAIPAGFFLGPGPDGRSQIGPIPRPTYALLTDVALKGTVPAITDLDRQLARDDLAYWHGSVIVLSDGGQGNRWQQNRELLLSVATQLFGPPQRVEDVWIWRVPTSG